MCKLNDNEKLLEAERLMIDNETDGSMDGDVCEDEDCECDGGGCCQC